MRTACLICLLPTAEPGYHPECLAELFEVPVAPRVAADLASIRSHAQRAAQKPSISGVQFKDFLDFAQDRTILTLAESGGRFIVKPQLSGQGAHPSLPENEHLTMRLGRHVGLTIPPCGLFTLADGSWAYLVRRFDRVWGADDRPPFKRRQLDLCQLADIDSTRKYELSAERCVDLVRASVAQPEAELRPLFQLFLFSYLCGNGDLHLKNISILEQADSSFALSPCYDLVCTWLYGDQKLALYLNGKVRDLKHRDWLEFAAYCGIAKPEASALIQEMVARLQQAQSLIDGSPLSLDMRKRLLSTLRKRVRSIAGSGS